MGLEERSREKEIAGTRYRVTPLPFGVGRPALMRLLKIMAPVLSAAVGENANAAILAAIPTVLTDEDVSWFAARFGDASAYQEGGKWIPLIAQNQELHFAGRYETFFRWLMFCVEVNFQGFFSGISKGVSGAVPGLVALTKPQASTG